MGSGCCAEEKKTPIEVVPELTQVVPEANPTQAFPNGYGVGRKESSWTDDPPIKERQLSKTSGDAARVSIA